ncbi:DNA primase [Pirellula staleyi DSM 6068]|uniref:DNA primase n=1 Tax=Pirellula staleyi (strain ATCC 27377 / DSM 6068 / ICPB 4128) TaxID=530564 RepID=D2R6R2_PIRSD|nr:DNA primase [Pirellula staleyi DSM 6068]
MLSGDAKEQVRQAVSIVDVVGSYMELRRSGRLFVGLCPWHNDSKPSLQVNPDRQTWKCWVCDIGGDIFSFIMQKEGCDFREALTMLADRAGVKLVEQQHSKPVEPGSPNDKNTLLACTEWARQQYHECFLRSEIAAAARDYVRERGITDESIRKFSIGYAPDQWSWLIDRARTARFSPAVLEATGLAGKSERGTHYDRFKGRLIFPIRDPLGRPIAFGGRILPGASQADAAKYINSPETRLFSKSENLYALDIAKEVVSKSRSLTVVEGYTDVIMCHQYGLKNVVAVLGTALNSRHIQLIRRFADSVTLLLDGDEAGQRRTNEILELFVSSQLDLRILTLPDEYDPAEILQEKGGDEVRRLLATAVDALEHKIRLAIQGIDPVRDTHLANKALEGILTLLAKGVDPANAADTTALRLKQILARLARVFRLDDLDIATRFKQLQPKTAKLETTKPITAAEYQLASIPPRESELLEIMALHEELVPIALGELSDVDITSQAAREVFVAYREMEESGGSLEFGAILASIENPALKSLLAGLVEVASQKEPKALHDAPTRMRAVLNSFRHHQKQRELLATEEALASKQMSEDEEVDVLKQLIDAKRQQQGIISPMDG